MLRVFVERAIYLVLSESIMDLRCIPGPVR